jgi:hypothetical protein
MARDLFAEAGIAPTETPPAEAPARTQAATEAARDLFAEAGITPTPAKKESSAVKFVNELPKELFQKSHPVAQLAIGAAKPFAGLAQYADINEPANFLNRMSERFDEGTGGGTALDIAGQILSPTPTKIAKGVEYAGKGLQYFPQVAQFGTKLANTGVKLGQDLTNAASAVGKYIPTSVADLSTKAGKLIDKSPIATGALQGIKAAVTNPLSLEPDETYGDFFSKKMEQLGEGAIGGGALGKLAQVGFNPYVSKQVQDLKDLGMKYFTPGQLASQMPFIGKMIQSTEAKLTSFPGAGNFIEGGLKTAAADFNRALGNEVLKPMGEALPKGIKAGEDMIKYLNDRVSDAYDTITPKLQLSNMRYKDPNSSTGFTTTVKVFNDKLADVTSGLPSAKGNNLAGMVKEEFDKYILDPLTKLSTGKVMTGEEFRAAEKNLGRVAFGYMRDPKLYDVGVALRDLQAELRKELSIQNPKIADELRGIHDTFIRHLPVERAAGMLGAAERIFSPSQFQSAVKAETKGKGKFASGQGTFYPESQAALDVLGKTIPDSGTAGRIGVGSATAGLGNAIAGLPGVFKALALPTLAAGAVYNKPVMGALTTLATERPQWMKDVSPTVEKFLSNIGGLNASKENPRPKGEALELPQ